MHSSAYLSQSQTASHVQEPQSQIQTHTGHAGYSEGPHLQSQHTIINSLVLHKKQKDQILYLIEQKTVPEINSDQQRINIVPVVNQM